MFWNFFNWVLWLFTRKPTVRRLLRGSRRIDKMRLEIKELTALLISHLNEFLKVRPDCSPLDAHSQTWLDITYRHDGDCYWQLTNRNRVFTGLTLWFNGRDMFVYESGNQSKLDLTDVEQVHEKLSMLLSGMLVKFPFMYIQLRPLVQASKRSWIQGLWKALFD